MLRIIHTGRAYEVLDLASPVYCLTEKNMFWLRKLRNKYSTLKTRYWQQGIELEKTRREIGDLKALHRQQTKLLGKTCRKVWRLKELLEATKRIHGYLEPQD